MPSGKYKICIMLILILTIVFLSKIAFAQAPDILWAKTFGGAGNDYGGWIEETNDGGFIVVGSIWNGDSDLDVCLLKIDNNGDTLWTRTFGGDSWDVAYWVHQTADNGFIIAGNTLSFGERSFNIYLIKTNSLGDTLWTKLYRGIVWYGQETVDGGYIFVGNTVAYNDSSYSAYLIKTDSYGDTLWTKTYGGEDWDDAVSVATTEENDFLILGYFNFPNSDTITHLIKTDSNGDTLWTKSFGDNYWMPRSIISTSDNMYLLLASSSCFGIELDINLLKINSDGDTIWTRVVSHPNDISTISVHECSDNGYIICGDLIYINRNIFVLKTNPFGEPVWEDIIFTSPPNDNLCTCIRQASDGGYVLVGSRFISWDVLNEVFIAKYNSEQVYIDQMNDILSIKGFSSSQNYPNPFNSSTTISFSLEQQTHAKISIYDITGRLVEVLAENSYISGNHSIIWNAGDLPSGIYFTRLETDESNVTKKLVLLK